MSKLLVAKDFPILDGVTYLDNAATTQKPRQVIDAVSRFYTTENANIHRAVYGLAAKATARWNETRTKVARFLNTQPARIAFTSGTTEALNGVAHSWGLHNLAEGDEILLSPLEHHANILPWQHVAQVTGARLVYAALLPDGRLDVDDLYTKMTPRTKLLTLTHVSNVLGIATPLEEIIPRARDRGIAVCIDGAQAVPHMRVDLAALNPDFYAFSAHKLLGPTGIGVLVIGGQHRRMAPYKFGGDMIDDVTDHDATYATDGPRRFEAGTQHLAGAAGLGAAIDYLEQLGMDSVHAHEQALLMYGWQRLADAGMTLYGPAPTDDPLLDKRAAVISFNVPGVHPHDVGTVLDEQGIAIRTGQHCAHPLLRRLGVDATCRASFYIYNTKADVDKLITGLQKVREVFA